MALGEILGWVAAGLSVALGILLYMQNSRLRRLERQFRALMKGAGATTLTMSLGDLVADQAERLEATRADIEQLRKVVGDLEAPVARSVQYVGVVRYNPFGDTGGDQSFAVALLDQRSDGVVISSLHGRTATRFYAKPVKAGTSHTTLSEEEEQAIQQALSHKGE
ncbi:MAG TPA: DUF4446 family protein [Chloroflexia bacterium]|nr:DUF4446 family protein [Chloroflexia bacterium]